LPACTRAIWEPADLVLLDMHLGSESGLGVMRAVRAMIAEGAGAGVTCIALSADGHPEQVVKALDAGFDDYWTKPIDLAALNRRLDALGRG
jgi:DNA-binding response OmpR family regulator